MIPWKPFAACPDSEIDEGLRIALNELGRWAERKRISLFAGHAHGIDLHMRLKTAIMLALDEVTSEPPEYQPRSDRGKPRKKRSAKSTGRGPGRPRKTEQ